MLKVLAGAVFAFGLPPAIFFASSALMNAPHAAGGIRGGAAGHAAWIVLISTAPFVGFGFLLRPFGRWRDLDRNTMLFCVGLSALYWAVYTPPLFWFLVVSAIGWGMGGI